jgi:PTH1 family peptidyl-tRNA hydrolase
MLAYWAFVVGGERAVQAIVGLGNPGPEYRGTRHNVGFAVLDRLAREVVVLSERQQGKALIARSRLPDTQQQLLLVKPLTYMNRSGAAVGRLVVDHDLCNDELLVVHDDLDLDLGRLRLRQGGSSAGHRGVQSIIDVLGTRDFPRLRCGIGPSGEGDVIDYVLSPFAPSEEPQVEAMQKMAVEAALTFVEHGLCSAMNKYIGRIPPKG